AKRGKAHGVQPHRGSSAHDYWREVVVHTSDLGYEYAWKDWPKDYVRFELDRQLMAWRASQPMGVKDFPDQVRKLPDAERLAWLLQRTSIDGLGQGPGI
ncbi:MAG: hypothetical protein ACKOFD_01095, partial [Actinomycetota bacterium]